MSYIERKQESVKGAMVENCHGGVGSVHVRQLLGEDGDFDSCICFMHETTVPKGTTIGLHPHHGTEELYYVISGRGVMSVDGREVELGPGDVCLTKQGSTHGFRNVGDEDVRVIVLEGDCR